MVKTKRKIGPRAQCRLCKDIIQSTSVHDFVRCKCKAIFVDGGGEYCRAGANSWNDILWLDKVDDN